MPKTLNNIHKRIESDERVSNNCDYSGIIETMDNETGPNRRDLRERLKARHSPAKRRRLRGLRIASKRFRKPNIRPDVERE